jgi:hypothetical protein
MQNEPVRANHSMKTHIMLRRALTALAFAALLALPPRQAQAQTNGAPQPKPNSAAPAPYDLVIENGSVRMPRLNDPNAEAPATLENIVSLLLEKHPEANIAIAPEIRQEVIPDLKMRAANLPEEFEFLRVASGDEFVCRRAFDDIANPLLFTLEPSEKFLQEVAKSDSRQVEVFNFSSYFDRRLQDPQPTGDPNKSSALKESLVQITKQIVTRTVNSVCGSSGGESLQFQFHPGANLLVVTGQTDALNIAKKVINAMIEQPGTPALIDYSAQSYGISPKVLASPGVSPKVLSLPDGSKILSWPDGRSVPISVDANFTPTNR